MLVLGKSWPSERLEVEVRVRIDEPRHDRYIAQVKVAPALLRGTHPSNPALLDRQGTIPDRWTFDGINVSRLERERAASQ
jgi:hypothetical protein